MLSLAYRAVVTTGQELFFKVLRFYKNRKFFYFRNFIFPQRKNRNAYTFRFPAERETGFEPATPTLARLYSTPEPLAHFLIFILLSARYTLQMIIYTNAPYLSTVFLNFFKKLKNIHDLHISHLFQSATTTSHRSATGRYRPHLPSSIPFPHTPQPPHADLPPADTDLPPVPNLRPWESSGGRADTAVRRA